MKDEVYKKVISKEKSKSLEAMHSIYKLILKKPQNIRRER